MSLSAPSVAEQALSAIGGITRQLIDGVAKRTVKPKPDEDSAPEAR